MMDPARLEKELTALQFIYKTAGPDRTFTIDVVEDPNQENFVQTIKKNSSFTKKSGFVANITELIQQLEAHAVRITFYDGGKQTHSKILRIKDDSPVIAFGERPIIPEVQPMRYYDDGAISHLQQQIYGLGEIVAQSHNASNGNQELQRQIEELKRAGELKEREAKEREWDNERKSLLGVIESLKAEIADLEEENAEFEATIESKQESMDRLKQVSLLAGLTWLKGGKPESLIQLAGLLMDGGGGVASAMSSLPEEPQESAPTQESPGEENPRRKLEVEIYNWMKALDETNLQKFGHLINGINTIPRLMERFLGIILKEQNKTGMAESKTKEETA